MDESAPLPIDLEQQPIPQQPRSYVSPAFNPLFERERYGDEEGFAKASGFFDSDTSEDHMRGAKMLLSRLTRKGTHNVQERVDILNSRITNLISFSLENPGLHEKLLSVIKSYYEGETKAFDRKAILKEILLQLNASDGMPNPAKETFAKRFTAFYKDLSLRDSNGGIRPITADMQEIFHDKDFANFYAQKGLDAHAMSKALSQTHQITVMSSPLVVPGSSQKREMYTMLKILSLEHKNPGICSRLQQQYGISAFFRYPEELLLELDNGEDEENKGKERVLVIRAVADSNGAMASEHSQQYLLDLKKYNKVPVVLEVDSGDTLERLVASLPSEIRESMRQGIIESHGSPTQIIWSEGYYLDDYYLRMQQVKRIFDMLPNLKNLSMVGCSTGKESEGRTEWDGKIKSIAEQIRDTLRRATVEAPPADRGASLRATRYGVKYTPERWVFRAKKNIFSALE